MKSVVYMVIACVSANTVVKLDAQKVDISVETVLRIGKKDTTTHGLAVIEKVEYALMKLKKDMLRQNGRRSNLPLDIAHRNDLSFTEFVSEAAKILKEYDDDALEEAFISLQDETQKYINTDRQLQKEFGAGDFRRHISEQLDRIREMQAGHLRHHINKVIDAAENKKKTGERNDFFDIGNLLYIGGGQRLKSALRNLDKLRRSRGTATQELFRDTLKKLIFDYFSSLNENIKRSLIDMAKDVWREQIRKNRIKHNLWSKGKLIEVTRYPHLKRKKLKTQKSTNNLHITTRQKRLRYKNIGKSTRFTSHFKIYDDMEITNGKNGHDVIKTFTPKMSNHSNHVRPTKPRKNKSTNFPFSFNNTNPSTRSEKNDRPKEPPKAQISQKKNAPKSLREILDAVLPLRDPGIRIGRKNLKPSSKGSLISLDVGVSIDKVKNDNMTGEVIRKSNKKDAITIENPSINMKHMIVNIEKQIEDVRDQVDYVRHLANNTAFGEEKPNFKTFDSGETVLNNPSKLTNQNPDYDSLERNNQAFFDSVEQENEHSTTIKTRFEFRAHGPSEDIERYSKSETSRNTVPLVTKATSKIINTTLIHKTKEHRTVKTHLHEINENHTVKNNSVKISNKTSYHNLSYMSLKNNITQNGNTKSVPKTDTTINTNLNEIFKTKTVDLNVSKEENISGFRPPVVINFTKTIMEDDLALFDR